MRFLEDNGVLYEERGPVMWRCEGCGFRLDLPEGVAPPMWHTLDRPMETPPDVRFPIARTSTGSSSVNAKRLSLWPRGTAMPQK